MSVKLGTFTVPVDLQRLQALRKAAGFSSRRAFAAELRRRGYGFDYSGVERGGQPSRGVTVNRIKSETAETVAEALGLEPDEAFPEYSASKAAAERRLMEERYKPFTTLAERNVAIVATMDAAKWTAWKFASVKCDGVPIGWDEAISCAYETLVEAADQAMKHGIPKGTTFTYYACAAIRNDLLNYYGGAASAKRKYSFCSLDLFSHDCFEDVRTLSPEDIYILREDLEERRTAENCRHKNGGKSHA